MRPRAYRSRPHRVDVARVGVVGQIGEPMPDLVGRAPGAVDEGLAFAERGVEAVEAERDAALERRERDGALDGGELERQGRRRMREPGQRLSFKTLPVDLHAGGRTVAR